MNGNLFQFYFLELKSINQLINLIIE